MSSYKLPERCGGDLEVLASKRGGERGVRTLAHEGGEGTLSALELAQRNDELGLDRAWPGWGSKLRRFLLVESVKPRSQHAWCGVL